jgi:hypothetical protein
MFLQESGLVPLSMSVWRRFEILYQPASGKETATILGSSSTKKWEKNGIYVYTREDGTVLYVGKAKPLRKRLWSHYLESFQINHRIQRFIFPITRYKCAML